MSGSLYLRWLNGSNLHLTPNVSGAPKARPLEPSVGPLCLCGSTFLYGIPCASSHVNAESLLDQRHEYGPARVREVSGKDLASIHSEDVYAICHERQRKLRFVG